MADLGACAQPPAPGRRGRRPLARAVCPYRRRAHRRTHLATATALGPQGAAADSAAAAAYGQIDRRRGRASRRTRDHRAELRACEKNSGLILRSIAVALLATAM